ncbi:ankyrin repeat-containing domain protein [Bombardia bombarda]|uniref:Ankyrin repeat-containing domain protein n=1 Tax=Bombardia bombarda TaxID=252184 RepID=A0AA39TIJ6_9PEZI|nr:ankyrin repeat-containing domain protein [Bombardia bombarda]
MAANLNSSAEEYGDFITAAAKDGRIDIFEWLLEQGASINSDEGFALQAAAGQGNQDMVKCLLDYGADVNHLSSHHPSGTPLQAACEHGHYEMVKLLLERGADPNLGGGKYKRPIIAATKCSRPQILKLLLKAPGIEIDILDGPGEASPLNYAAQALPASSVKDLLDAGAAVGLVDADGDTALMGAAFVGDAESVKVMLHHGADFMIDSPDFGTALEVAVARGNHECARLLVARAAAVLRELKQAADNGSATAKRIVELERQGRQEAMVFEEMKHAEEEAAKRAEEGSRASRR